MAQLLVRNLRPEVVRALKRRAGEHGVSAEEEHRRILLEALDSPKTRAPTLKEHLLSLDHLVDELPLPPREMWPHREGAL